MENKTNQSITKVLQSSNLLQEYMSKAKTLEKLTHIIKQYLEPELAKNCRVANSVDNCLILATSSAAWNHRLRFLVPDLLNKLRNLPEYYGLKLIEVIQDPFLTPVDEKTLDLPAIQLSKSNARQMLEVAANLNNEALAGALRKIAQHHVDTK